MKTLTFQEEEKNNEQIFRDIVQKLRPDIFVLMDVIDKTGVNPFILYKIARQLNNIAIGSGWGEVSILINNKQVVRVAGTDTEKVNEPTLLAKNT